MPKVHVRDIELYYELNGRGDPLLLIHGLGSSARDWDLQVEFFSKHYTVVTVDLRGHGKSDHPSGRYSIALFSEDIHELIITLKVAPVHLMGISLGGLVCLQLAVDHPGIVKTLTVVNAWAKPMPRSFTDRVDIVFRVAVIRLFGMRMLGRVLSRRLFPKPEHEEVRREMADRWAGNDKKAYLKSLRSVLGWGIYDQLPRIACPTLVVSADQDFIPLTEKCEYVKEIPDARLVVIEDSRHATPVEKPDAFNAQILAFLRGTG